MNELIVPFNVAAGLFLATIDVGLTEEGRRAFLAVFVATGIAALLWSCRAIGEEYVKIFWFRRIHRTRLHRLNEDILNLLEKDSSRSAEWERTQIKFAELLDDNDRLLERVIRLEALLREKESRETANDPDDWLATYIRKHQDR